MITKTIRVYDIKDYDEARKNMTNEEAFNLLKVLDKNWVSNYIFDGTQDDFYKYILHIALCKAMDTLRGVYGE